MSEQIKTTAEAAEAAALPEAYAVHVDKEGQVTSQKQGLPQGMTREQMAQKSPAEWAYERIVMYIQNFEKQLDAEHEVGMGFAAGDVGSLKIEGMGYFAPDMITFMGSDPEGNKMQLVQHVSQLNVMLVSELKAPDAPEANRIGFKLAQDLEVTKSS